MSAPFLVPRHLMDGLFASAYWGKPPQPVTGDDGEGPIVEIRHIIVSPKNQGGTDV